MHVRAIEFGKNFCVPLLVWRKFGTWIGEFDRS